MDSIRRLLSKNGTRVARLATASLVVACVLVLGTAGDALAEKKVKSVQTEASWIAFDAEAKTIEVKIKKPGRGNKDRGVKRGKRALFDVKPEGSVLTRTTVKINGVKGELTDIPEGKVVNLYWRADKTKETGRFVRSIDVIFSEKELKERYGFDEDE